MIEQGLAIEQKNLNASIKKSNFQETNLYLSPEIWSKQNISQMKVTLISIPVRDQEKALKFYTEKLNFLIKKDKPLDGGHRWVTLVSKEAQDGPELLLEPAPIHFEPSKVYQDALMDAGIPWTQFEVGNVDEEYERLTKLDVEFSVQPATMGTTRYAVFNDTCGNNIKITQEL